MLFDTPQLIQLIRRSPMFYAFKARLCFEIDHADFPFHVGGTHHLLAPIFAPTLARQNREISGTETLETSLVV